MPRVMFEASLWEVVQYSLQGRTTRRYVIQSGSPDHVEVHHEVLVHDLVPHTGDLVPWDFAVGFAERGRHFSRRFPKDLQLSEDRILLLEVPTECSFLHSPHVRCNPVDGVDHMANQDNVRTRHRRAPMPRTTPSPAYRD